MLTPEREYNSTIAYLTFPEEYEKCCSNATWAGEEPMTYSLWLERYKCVCPEDILPLESVEVLGKKVVK